MTSGRYIRARLRYSSMRCSMAFGRKPGELAWDLYAGVGLFSAALAERVGPDRQGGLGGVAPPSVAARQAQSRRSAAGPMRRLRPSNDSSRGRSAQGRLDAVVLDPPRAGAGAKVIKAIARREPRVIAYVACDPAALGRDLRTLAAHGYSLTSLRALDIFPTDPPCRMCCHLHSPKVKSSTPHPRLLPWRRESSCTSGR